MLMFRGNRSGPKGKFRHFSGGVHSHKKAFPQSPAFSQWCALRGLSVPIVHHFLLTLSLFLPLYPEAFARSVSPHPAPVGPSPPHLRRLWPVICRLHRHLPGSSPQWPCGNHSAALLALKDKLKFLAGLKGHSHLSIPSGESLTHGPLPSGPPHSLPLFLLLFPL